MQFNFRSHAGTRERTSRDRRRVSFAFAGKAPYRPPRCFLVVKRHLLVFARLLPRSCDRALFSHRSYISCSLYLIFPPRRQRYGIGRRAQSFVRSVRPAVHSRGRALFRYRLVAPRDETRRGEARQRNERKRDDRRTRRRRARFLATGCQGPPGPRAAPARLPRGPVRRRGWLP